MPKDIDVPHIAECVQIDLVVIFVTVLLPGQTPYREELHPVTEYKLCILYQLRDARETSVEGVQGEV